MKQKVYDQHSHSFIIVDRHIVLTFEGNGIPDKIKINLGKFPVESYFYPVIHFFECLQYGYISKQCKCKTRCVNMRMQTVACGDQKKCSAYCKS